MAYNFYMSFFLFILILIKRLTKNQSMQKNFKNNRNQKRDGNYKKRPFKKRHTRADFYIAGNPDGVKVPDSDSFTLEKALKYLKRQLKDSEKLFLYKNKRYYEKPSQVRKVKMERAVAMQRREDAIQRRMYGKNNCWLVMTKDGAK